MFRPDYLLWLAGQAADGILWAWPISLFLVLSLLSALFRERSSLRQCLRPSVAWQLLLILNPIALLLLGAVFACEDCSPSALGQGNRHLWAMRLADFLLVGQIAVAAWCVWKGKPCRLAMGAAHLLLLWCTFWAAFMAGMSMSGDWL
jgi:hypothetical protein